MYLSIMEVQIVRSRECLRAKKNLNQIHINIHNEQLLDDNFIQINENMIAWLLFSIKFVFRSIGVDKTCNENVLLL